MGLRIGSFTLILLLLAALYGPQAAAGQGEDAPLSPTRLQAALKHAVSEQDFQLLATRIRNWIGADLLVKGAPARAEGLVVAWAIEAPGVKREPRILSEDGKFSLKLARIPGTDLYTGTANLPEGTYL